MPLASPQAATRYQWVETEFGLGCSNNHDPKPVRRDRTLPGGGRVFLIGRDFAGEDTSALLRGETAPGDIDTWNYQWAVASWPHGGISILPELNLVSNIGFGAEATHTTGPSHLAARPAATLPFPLRHPLIVQADLSADRLTQRHGLRPQWRSRLVKIVQLVQRQLRGGH